MHIKFSVNEAKFLFALATSYGGAKQGQGEGCPPYPHVPRHDEKVGALLDLLFAHSKGKGAEIRFPDFDNREIENAENKGLKEVRANQPPLLDGGTPIEHVYVFEEDVWMMPLMQLHDAERRGAYYCLLAAADPRSPLKVPVFDMQRMLWPIAIKLKARGELRRELKLEKEEDADKELPVDGELAPVKSDPKESPTERI